MDLHLNSPVIRVFADWQSALKKHLFFAACLFKKSPHVFFLFIFNLAIQFKVFSSYHWTITLTRVKCLLKRSLRLSKRVGTLTGAQSSSSLRRAIEENLKEWRSRQFGEWWRDACPSAKAMTARCKSIHHSNRQPTPQIQSLNFIYKPDFLLLVLPYDLSSLCRDNHAMLLFSPTCIIFDSGNVHLI